MENFITFLALTLAHTESLIGVRDVVCGCEGGKSREGKKWARKAQQETREKRKTFSTQQEYI